MALDILELIFVEILNYPNYVTLPGGTMEMLVRGLFLPTIIIIVGIYFILGKMAHLTNAGLRLLLGVGIYLFIIINGWYGGFVQITQAYMIFLIVILGILFFIPSHFTGGGGGGSSGGGGPLSVNRLRGDTGQNLVQEVQKSAKSGNIVIPDAMDFKGMGSRKLNKLRGLYKKQLEKERERYDRAEAKGLDRTAREAQQKIREIDGVITQIDLVLKRK